MTRKISSAQLRAARALLRWSALDLANASKVGVATIRRAEVVEGEIPVTLANEAALRQALQSAGVEFTNGERPGVRLSPTAPEQLAEAKASASTKGYPRARTSKKSAEKNRQPR
jgi:hypothetical protein